MMGEIFMNMNNIVIYMIICLAAITKNALMTFSIFLVPYGRSYSCFFITLFIYITLRLEFI